MSFDYIVVGAGSAGCVLASRLSDDKSNRVLLIEAGGPDDHPFISMPRGFFRMWGKPEYFWTYPIRPNADRGADSTRYGKVLGGSSALNGMWYMRGEPGDFNGWAAAGNPGWGWDEISRCYHDLEDYRAPGANPIRGDAGPLQITRQPYRSPVTKAILAAGEEIGLPILADINTPGVSGIGATQLTVDRRGRRASSYSAFIKPVLSRPNLTVMHGVEVKRVQIEKGTASGVICDERGVERVFKAGKEVILCGGALQSPKMLQLSGIGPADTLARAEVPVIHALEAVGRNFCDHASIAVTYRLQGHPGLNREFSTWRVYIHTLQYYLGLKGLMAAAGMPITALTSSEGEPSWPNIQLGISPFSIENGRKKKGDPGRARIEPVPGLMINGFDLRPRSRGRVEIVTSDFRAAPEIDMTWWSDPTDARTQIEIVRTIRKLARTRAMQPFCGVEVVPGEEAQTDEQILEELKWLVSPGVHANGTCRMGPDPQTCVVDAKLRVHGVAHLRVADASIMPTPTSGNTNAPAMVIGARAAELIAGQNYL